MAHRRLSIIDLSSAGAQPMTAYNGRLRIVFNGEIYNYRDLRSDLEKKGYYFHSQSDTEVLLHLYADKGEEMLHDLRGMYAFAIWDVLKKELFLARDPFGIKPLYYADNGYTFRVASQVKALLKSRTIDSSPDAAGHVGFFLWGSVPEPYTLFHGIKALPAGTYMCVGENGPSRIKKHCNISEEIADISKNPAQLNHNQIADRIHAVLSDSITHHLIADVPVGVFLSSGLDSTTLTALAVESGIKDLHTVTLGFKEFHGTENDETPLAEKVAEYYGTVHQTVWVTRKDFQMELPRLIKAMDQPSIDGVNTYFVSRAAAETGLKVAISGLGGDELFGGYPGFKEIPKTVKFFSPVSNMSVLGRGFRWITGPVLKHFTSPKYAGLLEYGGSWGGAYLLRRGMFMPWELPNMLDSEMVRIGWNELKPLLRLEETVSSIKSDYLKVSALEMSWYMRTQLLRDADWAGMAHSLEIRVPLVDMAVLRNTAPLFTANYAPSKQDMAKTLRKPLPAEILNRSKTGFSVPVRKWMLEGNPVGAAERGLRGWAKAVKSYYEADTASLRNSRAIINA
jgi:asparagine synthase (glutamine-hydrolysing)